MKIKNYIAGSILFFSIMACVVPGLSQPVPPTFDLDLIPTLVVLTANALEAQTAVAALQITPTFTPAVSATPKISLSGTSLLPRDDQTTVFTDYRVGIELIIPAGWLAVRINEDEYYDAWVLPELSNPAYQRALASIQDLNPNETRLSVLDVQEGHLQDGFVTNINLFWFEKDEISLEDDEDLLASADFPSETMPDLKMLTAKISATSNGIPIGIIISKMPGITAEGVSVVTFYKQVFVRARTGVLTITLATTEELKDIVFPVFDAMIETITLVDE